MPPVPHSSQPQRLVRKPECGLLLFACRQPTTSARRAPGDSHSRAMVEIPASSPTWSRPACGSRRSATARCSSCSRRRKARRRGDQGRARPLRRAVEDGAVEGEALPSLPGCRRVVEKMSGCDQMRCGTVTAASSAAAGSCSTGRQRRPTGADLRNATDEAADGSFDGREKRLQLDAEERHEHCPGAPMQCDACGEDIVGPRLRCVQCIGEVDLSACVVRDTAKKPLMLRDGTTKHPKGTSSAVSARGRRAARRRPAA